VRGRSCDRHCNRKGILVRKKDKFRIVRSIDLVMRLVAVEVYAAYLE